jgi:uncharacterized protein (DUF2249 family)/iron-sulfur cluster repair protein YtfE (RIC family)
MGDVLVATNEADADAAAAVEQHHAMLAGALAARVERLATADEAWRPARDDLATWCRRELVPHAQAEEKTLYPAARSFERAQLLVDAMVAEHGVILGLVDDLAAETEPIRAAGLATALQVVFDSHLAKENDQIIPLLAQSPGVDLAGLLAGMHELLGHQEHREHSSAPGDATSGGHPCSCGELDGSGYPELDARAVPHAIRHATIFGALDAVAPGGGLVLVAPHDPLPRLAPLEQRSAGVFSVTYLERGPEAWRLLLTRT